MNILIEYWYFFVIIAALGFLIGTTINKFIQMPNSQKLNSIKQWAIYACALAQKELGSGTGELKMRYTYDLFVSTFPFLAQIISYERYKEIAENALLEFKRMLETNPNVKRLVEENEE